MVVTNGETDSGSRQIASTFMNTTTAVETISSGQETTRNAARPAARVSFPGSMSNTSNPRPAAKSGREIKGRTTNAPSNVPRAKLRQSASDVAASITEAHRTSKTKALDIAFEDLKSLIMLKTRDPSNDREADRQALLKRMNTVKGFLSSQLLLLADAAQMHVEHEVLHRRYANADTMGLEPVSEIRRANFWVSEDAYAWDMEELAAAISSNRGIMRNPLSKLMFHPRDVRAIVQHPLGKHLAALQVDQSELRQGVREKTVEKLDTLAWKLLDDETEDFEPSHRAIEVFAAYLATLPDREQEAIDELWVPATDFHTGLQFDMSVGQAVGDAQNNLVCVHKTGDLLSQAVSYLRGKRTPMPGTIDSEQQLPAFQISIATAISRTK